MIKTSPEKMNMHKYMSTDIFRDIINLLVIILHDENWKKITGICKSNTHTGARVWVAIKHYNSTHQLGFSQRSKPSNAWARIPTKKRKALQPQSQEFLFVGYFEDSKGYKLINLSTNKYFIEISVQFQEEPLVAVEVGESSSPPDPLIVSGETNECWFWYVW